MGLFKDEKKRSGKNLTPKEKIDRRAQVERTRRALDPSFTDKVKNFIFGKPKASDKDSASNK